MNFLCSQYLCVEGVSRSAELDPVGVVCSVLRLIGKSSIPRVVYGSFFGGSSATEE